MNLRSLFLWILIPLFSVPASASDSLDLQKIINQTKLQLAWEHAVDSILGTIKYEYGKVALKDDLATISVPEGFKYINGKDSDMILTDLWGNPPITHPEDFSLGMLIPKNHDPMTDSSFAINITYIQDGYIDDEDALEINYDEMLTTMQESAEASNEYRREEGYPTLELVGWASAPFYDKASKKLHWAKEIKFDGSEINTLNYNIRVLGRKGHLQLNAIGEMYVLDAVKQDISPILKGVNFNPGNRYADFNPDVDKIAAYGIGGLIAGKVLAKAGILAKLGLVFAKFWKIIIFGAMGLFAAFGRFFKRS